MNIGNRDFLPTASLETLRLRARLLRAVRLFFDERGYWEVETPVLSRDAAVDPHLDPFVTQWYAGGTPAMNSPHGTAGVPMYLQTSPEFGMKRLLVAGADAIYQCGPVFRNGERGRLHNPEFTMIEWYRTGDNYLQQMQVVEDLVRAVLTFVEQHRPATMPTKVLESTRQTFTRTTYRQALQQHLGTDALLLAPRELARLARELGIVIPESLGDDDRDGWLNLLLAERVEPKLGIGHPEFVYDYPASQAALSRVRNDDPPVAERFELYINGIEIANGYGELTDPSVLRQRIEAESRRRVAEGVAALSPENRLLDAMEAGLPECAGVALGFDRLVMLALGADSVDDVRAFPIERA